MLYRLLADLVVVAHLVFIVYALFGGLLGLWRKWGLWVHLPTAVWIAVIEFQGWICPLTPLEVDLRMRAGEVGYVGGFIERYVTSALYPQGLTREIQVALGVAVIAVNVTVYVVAIRRAKSAARRGDHASNSA